MKRTDIKEICTQKKKNITFTHCSQWTVEGFLVHSLFLLCSALKTKKYRPVSSIGQFEADSSTGHYNMLTTSRCLQRNSKKVLITGSIWIGNFIKNLFIHTHLKKITKSYMKVKLITA